jgi:hypothetical protein
MEINSIYSLRRAIPPWGDQMRLRLSKRALCSESSREELGKLRSEVPTTRGYELTTTSLKGDILTLLEKGHFNFAQRGDILTLL